MKFVPVMNAIGKERYFGNLAQFINYMINEFVTLLMV
jgi:hypothetical protein